MSHLRSHFLHLHFSAGQKQLPKVGESSIFYSLSSTSPSAFVALRRFCCGLMPTGCASRVPNPLFSAAAVAGCEPFRTFLHLAFCARAIFRRELADMIRVGCFVVRDSPELFNDSITEIARSNFSQRESAPACVLLEAAEAHRLNLPLLPPQVLDSAPF